MTEQAAPPPDVQVFRPPAAVAIWWVWLLFAVANLIDLAVQGRDHLALVAAFSLLLITGVVYVTAQRPRVVAGPAGVTVLNPVTEHRIGWAAVAAAEPGELLRVRCEWPAADGPRQRVIQAWAVHSSRRRELTAGLRAQRQARRGAGGRSGVLGGGFGAPSPAETEPDPLRLDAGRVVTTLTDRAARARQAAPDERATAPASSWNWAAVAVVIVPALALVVVALL